MIVGSYQVDYIRKVVIEPNYKWDYPYPELVRIEIYSDFESRFLYAGIGLLVISLLFLFFVIAEINKQTPKK